MKYLIDWIHWYSIMSDFEIIEADNRKKAIQLFIKNTKNIIIPLKSIKIYKQGRSYWYVLTCMPVQVNDSVYIQWSLNGLMRKWNRLFYGCKN